ncbi:hypothetical protein [Paenibacillus wenxiniae]|uniref:Uncharacterized protein n=1 Tax=Paenibacillus wenxiniae TaxID=1636843 RepID=A0ABW4RK07_9BACL
MRKITDFYSSYEGEPEIIFYFENLEGEIVQLKAWMGYFDAIMAAIAATQNGWNGLSYYYHLDTGWFEKRPWRIPDLDDALQDIQNVDTTQLDHKALLVYRNLYELLHQAKLINQDVWVEYS